MKTTLEHTLDGARRVAACIAVGVLALGETCHVLAQADPSKSLRPRSFLHLPIGDYVDEESRQVYSSTFSELTWQPPLFPGQPVITQVTVAPTSPGGCSTVDDHRTTVTADFQDNEGDVDSGSVILEARTSLYGARAELVHQTFLADSGISGSSKFDVCIDFAADFIITLEISLVDRAGNQSAFVSVDVTEAGGASRGTSMTSLGNEVSAELENVPTAFLQVGSIEIDEKTGFDTNDESFLCFSSVRVGVGPLQSALWDSVLTNPDGECSYEIDLTEAEVYLPPSTQQPWFVEATNDSGWEGLLMAFSIRTDSTVHFARDLPQVIPENQTGQAAVSESSTPQKLLGYRVLEDARYPHRYSEAVQISETIPPYATRWVDLSWEVQGGGPYWIEALYEKFAALGYPEGDYLFFDQEDGNPVFNTSAVKTRRSAKGVAWGDYDDDGDPDLFVSRNFPNPNILFENRSGQLGLRMEFPDAVSSMGAVWGDYDNDGDLDLFVANRQATSRLYHNQKDESGAAILVAVDAGSLTREVRETRSAAWADYDADGCLDLFLANHGEANSLFNSVRGVDGRCGSEFVEDKNVGAWILEEDDSWGGYWADYDNDGDPDLLIINDIDAPNKLLENRISESGQFVPVNGDVSSTNSKSVSASWADIDNNGYLDLFVANRSSTESNWLFKSEKGPDEVPKLVLQKSTGIEDAHNSNSSSWSDIDSDGDLDLLTSVLFEQKGSVWKPALFMNNGSGHFNRPRRGNVDDYEGGWNGAAWADVDSDGYRDLIWASAHEGSSSAFRNQIGTTDSTHWIGIRLRGIVSNRSAIGARVIVVDGRRRQTREIFSLSGSGGQDHNDIVVGLGRSTNVDSILVRWPSGLRSDSGNVGSVNRYLTIDEPVPAPPPSPRLNDPVDNAMTVAGAPIQFTWFEVPEADSFRIEIGRDEQFTVIVANATVDDSVYVAPYLDPGTYYWHVLGINLGGRGDWSTTWTFEVLGQLPAPQLAAPSDGQKFVEGDSVEFIWGDVGGASRYNLQIWSDTLFSDPRVVDDTLEQNRHILTNLQVNDYWWRVRAMDNFRTSEFSVWRFFAVISLPPAIERMEDDIPRAFALMDNYPDPFVRTTTIQFDVASPTQVKLAVYDLTGRNVANLVQNRLGAGRYRVSFPERNDLAAGVYIYSITMGGFSASRTMVLLR